MNGYLPFWQSEPCPPWCITRHEAADLPGDRQHYTHVGDGVQRTLAPSWDGRPLLATVALRQHVRESTPTAVMWFALERQPGDIEFDLTIAEARELAAQLAAAVEAAEAGQ